MITLRLLYEFMKNGLPTREFESLQREDPGSRREMLQLLPAYFS